MDNTEETREELKVEEISVDNQALNKISLSDQIHRLAKDKEVMKERKNVFDLLKELEGKATEKVVKAENDREDRE